MGKRFYIKDPEFDCTEIRVGLARKFSLDNAHSIFNTHSICVLSENRCILVYFLTSPPIFAN